jgi:hypothetical protein
VNGTVIWTTEPWKITIGTTTFRLAPGQTMEQFLGNKGMVPNVTDVYYLAHPQVQSAIAQVLQPIHTPKK